MNALRHSGAVILCIDDRQTEAELDLLKRVLEKAGYCVLATTNAHKALEIFHKNKVDLVLTEHIQLTAFGVPSIAAKMKSLKPDVPVVLYSADLADPYGEMRFADIFLTKVVSRNALLCTIDELLDKGPARAAA
jgi:two-component SAPR family response regulator